MNQCCVDFYFVFIEDMLVVVGGWNENGVFFLVEMYSLKIDFWFYVVGLLRFMYGYVGIIYKDFVYIFGGYDY